MLKIFNSFEEMINDLKFGDLIIRNGFPDKSDNFFIEIVIEIKNYSNKIDDNGSYGHKTFVLGASDYYKRYKNKINLFVPSKSSFFYVKKVI